MRELERKLRLKLKEDFIHYANRCLKIRSKSGAIKKFKLNKSQLYIHQKLEEQLQKTGKVRAIILKGRQQGCSTYVAARFYWKLSHLSGVRAFILTHLETATQNLYQIVRRFHDNCPDLIKPYSGVNNSKELIFSKLDSGYKLGTAKSSGVGRSDTIQFLHGSEIAFWQNAESHISGLLQAVSDVDNTEVIFESTSDGADGLFYKIAMDAKNNLGEYQLIFIPWFWQDEYKKDLPDDFKITVDEEIYRQKFNLENEQIYWRRLKIIELGGNHIFRMEYPATVKEAFHSDKPNALWQRKLINDNRILVNNLPEMVRIIVAIDPAISSNLNSNETGIIVAGLGIDGHGYVLDDLSNIYKPSEWAKAAINAYYKYQADRIVAEVNQGGDMVENTIRTFDKNIAYKSVYASRGKHTRAEPIAALDEIGKIHHAGEFPKLEDQMVAFDNINIAGRNSPDRVDARVWALTELMLNGKINNEPKIWRA